MTEPRTDLLVGRDAWRTFICDPTRAGRYLSGLGASSSAASAPVSDQLALEFMQKLSGERDVQLFVDAIDLLVGGYSEFVQRELRSLIRALQHRSTRISKVVGPGLRGTVDWTATAIARQVGSLGPTALLARVSERSFNIPENRVLLALCRSIQLAAERLISRLGTTAVPQSIRELHRASQEVARNYHLRQSGGGLILEQGDLWVTHRSRTREYRSAAKLMTRRQNVDRSLALGKWPALVEVIRANWLEPVNDDDLFELYVLTLALDILEREIGIGRPSAYGLNIAGRGAVAIFEDGSTSVEVFFDQAPNLLFNIPSRYLELAECHVGLDAAPRRPDIAIVARTAGIIRRVVLIEAKRSSDGPYSRDSVYKCLGYLHDLAQIWAGLNQPNPRIVLVFPSGIRPSGAGMAELAAVSGDDRLSIASAMHAALAGVIP